MDYFNNVYLLRLNRYGKDYQSRLQNKREENFENYLLKSVYRIDFIYNNASYPATFEKYKQDNTETLAYLLTRKDLELPNGSIINVPDREKDLCRPWLIYYKEEMDASGYNRYIALKMTHCISWTGRDNKKYTTCAYMYGQEDNMLKDELKSRSRSSTLYNENLKMSFFVIPTNEHLRKEDYLEVGEGILKEGFVVTGYDINSTPGVEFVTVDPVYLRDHSALPLKKPQDSEEDWYWLNKGGATNGC